MVANPKRGLSLESGITTKHPLVQIGLFCAAGLLLCLVLMTYGLDLSPGFF